MEENPKITEKMTIGEVIANFPEAIPVFLKYGLHCAGCPMSEPETVKQAARLHQIEIKRFIKELNEVAKKEKK